MHSLRLRHATSVTAFVLLFAFVTSCGGDSGGGGPPEPSSVTVTPGADTLLAINETQAFTAEILDDVGHPVSGAVITWTSSDTSVVSIGGSSGIATARKNGAAQIVAHVGDLSGSASAIVTQIVTSVTVTPGNAAVDGVGDTVRFTAVAKDAGNTVVAGVQVIWSVNDNTVATIDTLGLATAKGPGVVLVTALAQTRAGYAALGVTQTAATVAFTSIPDSGKAGASFTKVVQVEVRDSNGHRVRNASLPVTIGVAGGNGPFGMVGSYTITTVDGVTNFPGLGVTRAGSLQLTASAPGVGTATSAAFTVSPEVPSQLKVLSLKDTMTAGDTLKASIEVQDRFANRTHLSGLYIFPSLRREYAPGLFENGSLTGVVNSPTVDGRLDVFPNRVTAAGSGWELVAVASGFDTAYGGNALILPGAPARTIVYFTGLGALSPWIGVGAARSPGLVGVITDAFLNLQPAAPPTLLTINDSAWSYQPPFILDDRQDIFGVLQATTVNGVAHFDSVGLLRPGPTYLVATGGGYVPWANAVDARLYNKHGLTLGANHACIFGEAGPLCWGSGGSGQLTTEFSNDSVARPVAGGGALVSVVAGGSHTCGLFADGTAACWGSNGSGELGRSTVTLSEGNLSVVVTAVKFSALAGGPVTTCGIGKTDSLAYCWGANGDAQLGDSTVTMRSVPTLVKGGHKFIQLSLGNSHTCGLEAGSLGLIWCWGRNGEGQLGTGSLLPTRDSVPTLVAADSNLTIEVGNIFSCSEFRNPSGGVQARCWGSNGAGNLGTDTTDSGLHPTPATVLNLPAIRPGSLTVGDSHACAVTPAGQLWCWGSNFQHAFANVGGETFDRPFQVGGFGTIPVGASVVAGGNFTCVTFPPSGFGVTVGDTKCIGPNDQGQLGNGTTANPPFPPVTAVQ